MKKKYRKIVVNDLPFGYIIDRWGEGCDVFLDKKPWKYFPGEQTWTPQRVKDAILQEIKERQNGTAIYR